MNILWHYFLKSPLQEREIRDLALNSLRFRSVADKYGLGIEGAAAHLYFQALTEVFPPAMGFRGRQRRPPPDPVNALLSLGYSMLHTQAVNSCRMVGLDPAIGFYHELAYGRESLAADLIEPLRPRYDRWAWRLLAEKQLRDYHFNRTANGCSLVRHMRELILVPQAFARVDHRPDNIPRQFEPLFARQRLGFHRGLKDLARLGGAIFERGLQGIVTDLLQNQID